MPNSVERHKIANKLRRLLAKMETTKVYHSKAWAGRGQDYMAKNVESWIKSLEEAEGALSTGFMRVCNDIWKEVK